MVDDGSTVNSESIPLNLSENNGTQPDTQIPTVK
jgi:hypothetical protein